MKKSIFVSHSPGQTRTYASQLASRSLMGSAGKKAAVFALEGELGSGKTTFAQGFAKGLGIKEKITSPTFLIYRSYKTDRSHFYHVDCYRLQKPKELLALGWKEIIADPANIVLVEWADRIKKILPRPHHRIMFKAKGKNKREITIA